MGSDRKKSKQNILEKVKSLKKADRGSVKQRESRSSKKAPSSGKKTKSGLPQDACASTSSQNKDVDLFRSSVSQVSILKYLNSTSIGIRQNKKVKSVRKMCVVNHIQRLEVSKVIHQFSRRATSIAWHPQYSHIVTIGSKGGELILENIHSPGFNYQYLDGIGPGGSIVGLKCDYDNPSIVYTTSIEGVVRRVDFSGKPSKIYASTRTFENWYSALDVFHKKNLILSADLRGNVVLMNTDGKKIWSKRLHMKKVPHVEFSSNGIHFVTASHDSTVRLWDLRMMVEKSSEKEKNVPLSQFTHKRSLHSACFSPSNGTSILTTDQHSELRVYRSPYVGDGGELITIPHPHRQFQHLTPIKASWHPLEDIVVVGRYPDKTFLDSDERTIDFYDGETGDSLYRMMSNSGGIVSLTGFDISGECLLSTASGSLSFWKDQQNL